MDKPIYKDKDRGLYVFFSVDISGSTAHKNTHSDWDDYSQHWTRVYESFFREYYNIFEAQLSQKSDENSPSFSHWKFLGDEILFYAKLNDFKDLSVLIRTFYASTIKYDLQLYEKHDKQLRLKGGAWTAGFPIRNSKIVVPDIGSSNQGEVYDFIGPDIDAGFRILKATRPGRVVVSMDLADLLSRNEAEKFFNIYHVGWSTLKGVMNDKPYPIFWLQVEEGEEDTKSVQAVEEPPWLSHECEYTNKFLELKGNNNGDSIGKEIQEIRDYHTSLNLFRPYIKVGKAPDEHKERWEIWTKKSLENQEPEYKLSEEDKNK